MQIDDPVSAAFSASIVVPAHNEERAIVRLLEALLGDAETGEFDIVIACNGCTDGTAEAARRTAPGAKVLESRTASKALALRAGDQATSVFPRLYVDADVELATESARRLVAALDGSRMAVAPVRDVPMHRASTGVREYYRVWQSLPHVAEGLFGRGVIGVSRAGYRRIQSLALLMSDDLAISQSFSAEERTVVTDATVTVYPPKTMRALVRRRARGVIGNVQLERAGLPRATARTSMKQLFDLARRSPRLLPGVAVFLLVAVVARFMAWRQVRRGDFSTWLRDDSREPNADHAAG